MDETYQEIIYFYILMCDFVVVVNVTSHVDQPPPREHHQLNEHKKLYIKQHFIVLNGSLLMCIMNGFIILILKY